MLILNNTFKLLVYFFRILPSSKINNSISYIFRQLFHAKNKNVFTKINAEIHRDYGNSDYEILLKMNARIIIYFLIKKNKNIIRCLRKTI